MPFGIIGRTGTGMRQVVGFADRSTRRGTLGANLGRAIVTNGDFWACVCYSVPMRPSCQITLVRLDRMVTMRPGNFLVILREFKWSWVSIRPVMCVIQLAE